jgi:hypothetical protein
MIANTLAYHGTEKKFYVPGRWSRTSTFLLSVLKEQSHDYTFFSGMTAK